jgi:uncharacterized iron-regulated membrane protein
VSGMGVVVATLSITGFVIWWRKRRIQVRRLDPPTARTRIAVSS